MGQSPAQIANSDAAREQMDIALGPQRATELQDFLHVETVMDAARSAVQANSTTAQQLVELGLAGGAGTFESARRPGGSDAFGTHLWRASCASGC